MTKETETDYEGQSLKCQCAQATVRKEAYRSEESR